MTLFRMPSLGSDMEAGTLVEWLVKPGDLVASGDIVAVVETQKGAIEVEIFDAGEVMDLLASAGDELPVGSPMAVIKKAGETPGDSVPEEIETRGAKTPPPLSGPQPGVATIVKPRETGLASPAARLRAQEAGLDLTKIAGSGPGGAVRLADVETELAGAAPQNQPTSEDTPSFQNAMRMAVSAAVSRSKQEIPHYYLSHEIDLQPATDWLAKFNTLRPPSERLILGALLIKATALAARKAPQINGVWKDSTYCPSQSVHTGVVISLRDGGLVAPALLDAAETDLTGLMANMRDLVKRARTGRLRSSEFSAPTITVSSLGDRGVDALYGIIFPPQAALVGFGAPKEKPWIVEGKIDPRLIVQSTLSADHRVSDGRIGARFLAEIATYLQKPEEL